MSSGLLNRANPLFPHRTMLRTPFASLLALATIALASCNLGPDCSYGA